MTPSAPPTPETPAAALKSVTPGPTTPGFSIKAITPALSPINTTLPSQPAEGEGQHKDKEQNPDEPHDRALAVVGETGSQTRLNTLLDSIYALLETWHLRATLDRAHVNSSPANPQPSSNSTAHTSTTPDDAFFILHLTLSRALSSGSVTCVRRTVKTVRDVVERDLVGVIRRRMEDCWRTGSGGPGAGGGKGKGAGEDRVAIFVVRAFPDILNLGFTHQLAVDLSKRFVDVRSSRGKACPRPFGITGIRTRFP